MLDTPPRLLPTAAPRPPVRDARPAATSHRSATAALPNPFPSPAPLPPPLTPHQAHLGGTLAHSVPRSQEKNATTAGGSAVCRRLALACRLPDIHRRGEEDEQAHRSGKEGAHATDAARGRPTGTPTSVTTASVSLHQPSLPSGGATRHTKTAVQAAPHTTPPPPPASPRPQKRTANAPPRPPHPNSGDPVRQPPPPQPSSSDPPPAAAAAARPTSRVGRRAPPARRRTGPPAPAAARRGGSRHGRASPAHPPHTPPPPTPTVPAGRPMGGSKTPPTAGWTQHGVHRGEGCCTPPRTGRRPAEKRTKK